MSPFERPSRRTVLQAGLLAAAGLSGPLEQFAARIRAGEPARHSSGFGNLNPVNDLRTGLPLVKLPAGFSYTTFGWEGDPLGDAGVTPPLHDGMTCLKQEGSLVTLCRNHEVDGASGAFGPAEITYDPQASAGCTNLVFDLATKKLVRSWASIAGTSRNCAGGPTPWGTWITCEEIVAGPGSVDKKGTPIPFSKSHGWAFEVPTDRAQSPKPLEGLGRFTHEALAIEPRSGIVYLTEDAAACGFYRFVPRKPGQLSAGGKLQMLRVEGDSDTRKLDRIDRAWTVSWVDIDDPLDGLITGDLRGFLPGQGVFRQGAERGAATFGGLEGAWYRDGHVIFTAKLGGPAGKGQIWQYDVAGDSLRLLYVSRGRDDLNMPDNICASPRGGLVVCEDGDEGDPPMRLQCLSGDGLLTSFCSNNIDLTGNPINGFAKDFRDSEWAGACFSPDGTTLFVNIQRPGISFAITGPWRDGLL